MRRFAGSQVLGALAVLAVLALAQPSRLVAQVNVNVGSASGLAGQTVSVAISLVANGNSVGGTSNDISFNNTTLSLPLKCASTGDHPNASCATDTDCGTSTPCSSCVLNPALAVNPPGKQLVFAVQSATVFRVGVFGINFNTIPDGLLVTCDFAINAGAVPGMYTLGNTPGSSTPQGVDLTTTGTNGLITVLQAATPTFTTAPATGTFTQTPTLTRTLTPTLTPANTATFTPTQTPSVTQTSSRTATPTLTPAMSNTPTLSPTTSNTPTVTATPVNTFTATTTGTATLTPSPAPSSTPSETPSVTSTATLTSTAAPSATPTNTLPPTLTPTTTATPVPQLTVQPSSGSGDHDFGSIPQNTTRNFTYFIRNSGGGTLSGTVAANCPGFSVNPTSFSLTAGQQTSIVVSFNPPGQGPFTCQLQIDSNGGNATFNLSGTGLPPIPVPVVASPTSPSGLALIGLLSLGIGWLLRTRRVGQLPR